MKQQTKPEKEGIMLLHASTGKFGETNIENVNLGESEKGRQEFKKLISNINLNLKGNEQRNNSN